MKFSHRKYDVNDLIGIVRAILKEHLNLDNAQVTDKFDEEFNMDIVTKERIIFAIEYILNYSLSNDEKLKINSINDVLVCYKSALDKTSEMVVIPNLNVENI